MAASEEIYREVKRIRDGEKDGVKKKLIVASIETVGARRRLLHRVRDQQDLRRQRQHCRVNRRNRPVGQLWRAA